MLLHTLFKTWLLREHAILGKSGMRCALKISEQLQHLAASKSCSALFNRYSEDLVYTNQAIKNDLRQSDFLVFRAG